METDFDVIVIGAGIVGLACARELASRGMSVAVLEAEAQPLTHTSSRNSEVIHAGIYYAPGSLKAKLCVEGKSRLYAYCQRKQVPHRQLGKLIVATTQEDVEKLERYRQTAALNGVTDLEWRSRSQVEKLEPDVVCDTALWSPSTGILDTHEYALSLLGDLESAGGIVVCNARVADIDRNGEHWQVSTAENDTVSCTRLLNAAGLEAVAVANSIAPLAAKHVPEAFFAIGHYFVLTGKAPFNHLIYPTASDAGLGVHVTLDIGGQARFGPDVQWVEHVDYRFDERLKAEFVTAIRRYYPGLDAARLQPGYTGIRPKIAGPGAPAADFNIQSSETHGCHGLVNLFGIESPGITASLAIAEYVADRL